MRNKTRKNKSIGGSFFKKNKDTSTNLQDLHMKVGNIKLKDIESKFIENIEKLKTYKTECKQMCADKLDDPIGREQIQDFIKSKSFYEWGNLCGNSMEIENCQNFLHVYSKLSVYSKYINSLNTKIQAHFDNITNQLISEQIKKKNKLEIKSEKKDFLRSRSASKSASKSSQYSFHSL
jgi:hypothetical protein